MPLAGTILLVFLWHDLNMAFRALEQVPRRGVAGDLLDMLLEGAQLEIEIQHDVPVVGEGTLF